MITDKKCGGNAMKGENTVEFSPIGSGDNQNRVILGKVYESLIEKGYDPINQIVGYLLSEDPTYITNNNGARALASKLDRDELLNDMVRVYLGLPQ